MTSKPVSRISIATGGSKWGQMIPQPTQTRATQIVEIREEKFSWEMGSFGLEWVYRVACRVTLHRWPVVTLTPTAQPAAEVPSRNQSSGIFSCVVWNSLRPDSQHHTLRRSSQYHCNSRPSHREFTVRANVQWHGLQPSRLLESQTSAIPLN